MGSNTDEFVKAVEPLADRDGMTADGCMLASIAISLKRIADAVTGNPTQTGIHEAILRISDK